jgi:hypothetical protein
VERKILTKDDVKVLRMMERELKGIIVAEVTWEQVDGDKG